MYERGIGDNWLQSIMVPFGYTVDLYDEGGFSGDITTIVGGMFEDDNQTMKCINLVDDWWTTSSLRVYKNRNIGKAQGYWISITGSTTTDFMVSYGLKSSVKDYDVEVET